jgi:hypothetical protein
MPNPISQTETKPANEQQAEDNPQLHARAKGQLGVAPADMFALRPALTHALIGLPAVGFFFVKNSSRQSNPASKYPSIKVFRNRRPSPHQVFPVAPTLYGCFSAGFICAENLFSSDSSSIGSGKTIVVFFSTPISVSVCR